MCECVYVVSFSVLGAIMKACYIFFLFLAFFPFQDPSPSAQSYLTPVNSYIVFQCAEVSYVIRVLALDILFTVFATINKDAVNMPVIRHILNSI